MTRKCQVRFGGGCLEKDGNVPRQASTLPRLRELVPGAHRRDLQARHPTNGSRHYLLPQSSIG